MRPAHNRLKKVRLFLGPPVMHELFTKILSKLISIILSQSKTLREQYFEIKEEHEILWTALDDISRMDKEGKMGNYAKKVLDKLPNRYDI